MSEMPLHEIKSTVMLMSQSGHFVYDDFDGLYVYTLDVNLRIMLDDKSEEFTGDFDEPWVSKFAAKKGKKQLVRVYYNATPVFKLYCVWVDSGQHLIPLPRIKDNKLSEFEYAVGKIINQQRPGFDQALEQAGIGHD